MPSKTVLIVDQDVGFVFWLGQIIAKAGHQALPATSTAGGRSLLKDFHIDVDLLVLNSALVGIRTFADNIRRNQGHLKIILVRDEYEDTGSVFPGVDALMRKPSIPDRDSEMEWLAEFERIFTADDTCQVRSSAS